MIRRIHFLAAAFLLLGTAGAFVLSLMEQFMLTLIVLTCGAIFLVVFVMTDEKPRQEELLPPLYNRYADYMRFCPECSYVGYQPAGDEIPPCPKCGGRLIATRTPLSEFTVLSPEERRKLKRRWARAAGKTVDNLS